MPCCEYSPYAATQIVDRQSKIAYTFGGPVFLLNAGLKNIQGGTDLTYTFSQIIVAHCGLSTRLWYCEPYVLTLIVATSAGSGLPTEHDPIVTGPAGHVWSVDPMRGVSLGLKRHYGLLVPNELDTSSVIRIEEHGFRLWE